MPAPSNLDSRAAALAELARITTLERGTLAEEFRTRPAAEDSGPVTTGPYYKHQCWEAGHNRSRRVPAAEVPQLREDLAHGQRFDELTAELAGLAIAEGRHQRAAALPQPAATVDAKKNSRTPPPRNASAKPRRSSHKSRPGSPGKGPPA